MANPKKNAKSSKTAHVLNLLAPDSNQKTVEVPVSAWEWVTKRL